MSHFSHFCDLINGLRCQGYIAAFICLHDMGIAQFRLLLDVIGSLFGFSREKYGVKGICLRAFYPGHLACFLEIEKIQVGLIYSIITRDESLETCL